MNTPCLIIAGEKSGEEHALSFIDGISKNCPNIEFFGVGGELLKNKNVELVYHLDQFSSWGISEVIGKIPFYINALKRIESEVIKRSCKVAILIDFQTFNLKLAKRLKKHGVQVLYYVAPQAWAWKAYRAKVIEKCVHTLFSVIPFEKKWFSDRGVKKIVGVNHPLWYTHGKSVPAISENSVNLKKTINILLLPGSRNFEVESLLESFVDSCLAMAEDLDVKISIVKSSSVRHELFSPYEHLFFDVYDDTKISDALIKADLCFAASGTVTLLTALYRVPTIVCYKSSLLNEFIFRNFISYDGPISLANIFHEKYVFPELTQERVTSYNIVELATKWLKDERVYQEIILELDKTKDLLKGDLEDVSTYMSKVINDSYEH